MHPTASAVRAEPDYCHDYAGSPTVGDTVQTDLVIRGHCRGVITQMLTGFLGPLCVVRFPDGTTADFHWQRCQVVPS